LHAFIYLFIYLFLVVVVYGRILSQISKVIAFDLVYSCQYYRHGAIYFDVMISFEADMFLGMWTIHFPLEEQTYCMLMLWIVELSHLN